MRRGIRTAIVLDAAAALVAMSCGQAAQASELAKRLTTPEAIKAVIERKARSVQLVSFPDTGWSSVKIVRGGSPTQGSMAPERPKTETAEIVTLADSRANAVRVIRGEVDRAVAEGQVRLANAARVELVTFANSKDQPVSVFRGSLAHSFDTAFAATSLADLDRVAFAVDGAESTHGIDPRMWRPDFSAAQGPMQVTLAAAADVGGGDRFDLAENRALGRAYLARMFRRYGNWPDAVIAYNWGPRNVDSWIGGGRAADGLPLEVERYRSRVLRDAALLSTIAMLPAR
jgi:Transglycosylase SLT domain